MRANLLLISAFTLCLSAKAQIPTTGLVGKYTFSGNANDQSGSSNNGTMTNGATFTTDRFGNVNSSASLDGVDDYIALPSGSITSLNITGDFSVSYWIKSSDVAGLLASIGDCVTSPPTAGGYLSGINAGGVGSGKLGVATRGTWTGSIGSINDNTWHNIVYVLQGTTLKIYIDNVLDKQATGISAPLSWAGARLVGCRNDLVMTTATNYAGLFDDMLIYNRALTVTEVGQVFTGNCSTPDISTGLVARYDFTGNANDLSGSGNNGTVTGATLVADRFGNANSAYSFNGTTDNINILNNSSLNFQTTNKFSLSYWINPSSLSATQQNFVLCKQTSMGANQDGWNSSIMTDYTSNYRIQNGTSTNACSFGAGTSTIVTNQFQHIVQIYDNGTSYMYLNGGLMSQTTCTALIGDNTSDMLIGLPTFTFSNSKGFTGVIDDIRVYNKAISSCDVDSLFNMPNSIATGITQLNSKTSFTLYPNPANDKIIALFNSNESKQISIELFDLLGNSIKKNNIVSSLGENKVEINLNGLAEGVYLIRVENSVQKIQVIK